MHFRRHIQGKVILSRLLGAALCLTIVQVKAQPAEDGKRPGYKHSVDFCPVSPLFKIYAIHYCYRISPSSEIILAPYYANIHYKDIGNTDAPGFIVGYRRYIWSKLHVDYQLIPQWDHFYEKNENKTYPLGFDLWNEFRLGYVWDFKVGSLPAFINVQWPFGFSLYSDDTAKPESFKKHAKENPFFYKPPMFFLGIRF
jgi:hypothetical protein